jgi:hypothetical protein
MPSLVVEKRGQVWASVGKCGAAQGSGSSKRPAGSRRGKLQSCSRRRTSAREAEW